MLGDILFWIILIVIILIVIRPYPLGRGYLQPVLLPEKLVRGDTRADPGRDEEAFGHDRPSCSVR